MVRATRDATSEFIEGDKARSNVVGMGAGVKWTNGEPTGEPAIVVLVSHKVAKETSRGPIWFLQNYRI